MYIYMYVCVYIYMYRFIYSYRFHPCCTLALDTHPDIRRRPSHWPPPFRFVITGTCWPSQDIGSPLVVCARVNRPFILPARLHCPQRCNAIARLLGKIRPPPNPLFVVYTPYTIINNNIV